MYDDLHLRDYRDRLATAERARRRQWSRPPRPPGAYRRALASALRDAADALAPEAPPRLAGQLPRDDRR